jgi:ribose/xylose/arabinose/galactoside ABC-type transport system permease subunit
MIPTSMIQQARKSLQAVFGLILILALFAILAPSFRQPEAIITILEQSVVLGIMAMGATVVLISGGLDLSVGSILGLCACVTGNLLMAHWPVWISVAAGLLAGLCIGLVNGLTVVWTRVPPFIVTLGMMMIARGLALMLGEGKNMSAFPESFTMIGAGYKMPVSILALVLVATTFILTKTKLGFHAFAIGGNEEVARLSGVPVKRCKVIYYCLGGLLAALAAVVLTARLDYAAQNFGEGLELQAIAAAVIGGTSLFGGAGGVARTVVGTLIIKSLNAGLIHCGVGSYWQKVAIGCVIILAVWVDILQRRQRA